MKRIALFLMWVAVAGWVPMTFAEEEKSEDAKEESEKGDKKEPKSIEELTEDSDLTEGLFSIYRDRKTGSARLLLDESQLDKEYLYFTYVENGVADSGFLIRGSYQTGVAKVIIARRFYDRIEFVERNTSYYYNPDKAIARSANANVTDAVLFSEKIESEDEEKGLILIKADGLFLTEALNQISPLPNPNKKPHEVFSMGKISKEKSKIRAIKNHPENTDIVVEYVFENEKPFKSGSPAVTDARSISIVVQHSLIAAPESPIEPRFDDPRVGYFNHQVTDLSSTEVIPYRDVIKRWRLEKKDPSAALSEPVKPIVYWIENTTPMELRPIIKAAGLRWNEAFEQAGFKNALQMKVQPDDAGWDAGDIRYNVLRWVSSPDPKYCGYGPSVFDPRSGENLGADIMLEHSVISRSARESDLLGSESSDFWHEDGNHALCEASLHARNETLFAMAALESLGADTEEKQRLMEEFIYFLTLHEIGHTLGLNHNFRSSHLHSLEDIYDPDKTYPVGLYGSVMDYPAIPFNEVGAEQGQFWTTRPGPYDLWAIEFGYAEFDGGREAETAGLAEVLNRSTDPELAFANDADDMRSPGKAIDPRAMIGDMTSDPIGFSEQQVELVKSVQSRMRDRLLEEGESYQYFRNGYHLGLRRFREAVASASRFIGGVYVDRSMVGQSADLEPFTPVAKADQERAMILLAEELFAPDAFDPFDDSARLLIGQRRGFDHRSGTEDPKLHTLALELQNDILDHLLHKTVLARVTDSSLYGNEYTVDAVLTDLTDAIFEADLRENVNTYRQNLQLEYVDRLLKVVNDGGYDNVSESIALNRLRWIERELAVKRRVDLSTAAHREHVLFRIETGLDPIA